MSCGAQSDVILLPRVGYMLRRGQACSRIAAGLVPVLFTVLIKWEIIRNGKVAINSLVHFICRFSEWESITELLP